MQNFVGRDFLLKTHNIIYPKNMKTVFDQTFIFFVQVLKFIYDGNENCQENKLVTMKRV